MTKGAFSFSLQLKCSAKQLKWVTHAWGEMAYVQTFNISTAFDILKGNTKKVILFLTQKRTLQVFFF